MTIKGNFFSHVVTHTNDALQALLAPAKTIATNAGVDGAVVVENIRSCDWRTGYNAMTGRYEDLLNAGVVDPCRVSRCALQSSGGVRVFLMRGQNINK
jgi:chaperonin GroEL (HSP60 family)